MVVLDSFPFQEDSDVQYLGGLRRSGLVSAGHRRENCFSSPEATIVNSGDFSSSTGYPGCAFVEQAENSHMYMEQVARSRGYMEGTRNSQGYMKCRLCHYQTKIESLLHRHAIKHSLDSDFRCPACDFRESDPCKFVDHIGTHQSGKLVRCCFCPKKMSRGKLKSHIRIHRSVELYDCSMCQFSTNYEKTIKSHMDVYHTKEYSCHQCNLIMTKHDLHWHMKFMHSVEPSETGESTEQVVPMPVPAGRGKNAKTPRFPTKIIPNKSVFTRKLGASKISRKNSIALKMQKLIIAKKQFNCGKCDYKTPFKKLLRAHRAKHSLDNDLVCTKCGFKENGVGKFASHLSAHSPKDLFECCFCSFQTPTRGTMSNHVSKHKPIPMYDCSECEFSARRPASVRKHTANVHGKKSRCKSCGTEMSRFAMLLHRNECQAHDIPDSGAGPSSQLLESEHYEPEVPYAAEDSNQLDENTVICEFCKKPYAKSYIRKHLKKCQIESVPDTETSKPNELKASVLEPKPVRSSLASDDVVTVSNQNGISDYSEPSKSLTFVAFESKSLGKNSERLTKKKPPLQCNSCFFRTRKKRLLKKHVVKHLIDFRLTCPECGHKEMSSFRFAHHILQHGSDPETFRCCFCSLSAPTSKRSYCAHLELHRPVNIFDCPKCEYSSNRADNVRNHCKNNHSKNRKCRHCGVVMSKARLIKHLLEHHGEVTDGNFKLGKDVEAVPVEASLSNSSYPQRINPTALTPDGQSTTDWRHTKHKMEMQEPAKMSCAAHDDYDSSEIKTPLFETDLDFLKCTKCTFRTKIQSLMDRHIAKHLQDIPFVCPLCGFQHMSSRKFANHWDKHECNAKKKFYQCCFCNVEVKKKNCLKAFLPQHIEEHRPVALQDCAECEFSSHSRYELDKHNKNQHVKKCECLLCGEVMTIFEHSFHTECKGVQTDLLNDCAGTVNRTDRSVEFSTLRRHSSEVQEKLIAALENPTSLFDAESSALADDSSKRAHPESRPTCVAKQYMHCNSCDYKTQLMSLLKRHVLKHLIDVPFSCKKCSFSSFDERTFADHIFTHSHSYKCHFCSHTAGNVGAAARHFSSHKIVAMQDCPKCEFTSKYKYHLVEHMKGKHLIVPKCSYCGMKMLKDELCSHERKCGRWLRSKIFSHFQSFRQIDTPDNRLTHDLDGMSSQVVAEELAHVEATSRLASGLNERYFFPVEPAGCPDDTEMKESLHEPDVIPTLGHSGTDSKSSLLTEGVGMLGSVHQSAGSHSGSAFTVEQEGAEETAQLADKRVVEVMQESKLSNHEDPELSTVANRVQAAIPESWALVRVGEDPMPTDLFCPASLAEMSTTADDVPTCTQELKSAAVTSSHDPGLNDPLCPTSSDETSPAPAVIQELKSAGALFSQYSGLKRLVRVSSTTSNSICAENWPAVIQESNSGTLVSTQIPGMKDPVFSTCSAWSGGRTGDPEKELLGITHN